LSLRGNLTLQIEKLSLEDLYFVLNEVQEKIIQKTSIIREMIPSMVYIKSSCHVYFNYQDEVWMKILGINQDVSIPFSLKLVCKSWNFLFSNLTLNEATILNSNSLNWYLIIYDHY
jgi:hypothetical protein